MEDMLIRFKLAVWLLGIACLFAAAGCNEERPPQGVHMVFGWPPDLVPHPIERPEDNEPKMV